MSRISRVVPLVVVLAIGSACSYFRPMPRVRPGTDMALPDPSLIDDAVRLATGCRGPDVGPVQVRNGDVIGCASSQKDTIKAAAPTVPAKKP